VSVKVANFGNNRQATVKPRRSFDLSKSQYVRYARVVVRLAAPRGRTVSKAASNEAELASTSLTRAANRIYPKEFNHMNLSATALGIDIAKLKFDVCLIKENGKTKHKVFSNNRHGFEQLAVWLDSHQTGDLHICLEATGS